MGRNEALGTGADLPAVDIRRGGPEDGVEAPIGGDGGAGREWCVWLGGQRGRRHDQLGLVPAWFAGEGLSRLLAWLLGRPLVQNR